MSEAYELRATYEAEATALLAELRRTLLVLTGPSEGTAADIEANTSYRRVTDLLTEAFVERALFRDRIGELRDEFDNLTVDAWEWGNPTLCRVWQIVQPHRAELIRAVQALKPADRSDEETVEVSEQRLLWLLAQARLNGPLPTGP